MKTLNLILMSAAAGLAVYSCSERTEEEVQNPTEKLDLRPLKKESNNQGNTAKVGDTIILQPTKLPTEPVEPADPTNPTDPNDPEIVHPGDVKPPKP